MTNVVEMKQPKFTKGERVRYIPEHACSIYSDACRDGVVEKTQINSSVVLVRTDAGDLLPCKTESCFNLSRANPAEEWDEEYGDVLWWHSAYESPYVGSPNDENWIKNYWFFWTLPPSPPEELLDRV